VTGTIAVIESFVGFYKKDNSVWYVFYFMSLIFLFRRFIYIIKIKIKFKKGAETISEKAAKNIPENKTDNMGYCKDCGYWNKDSKICYKAKYRTNQDINNSDFFISVMPGDNQEIKISSHKDPVLDPMSGYVFTIEIEAYLKTGQMFGCVDFTTKE
jgi:hypothetical protein